MKTLWIAFFALALTTSSLCEDKPANISRNITSFDDIDCNLLMYQILLPDIPKGGRRFSSTIRHPELYLWDNWGFVDTDGITHIYALAASRNFLPRERHFHAHWRHFTSHNDGKNWLDQGVALAARKDQQAYDNKSIWSGSVIKLKSGQYLSAYTALDSRRSFLQTISLAISNDAHSFTRLNKRSPLLSHETQHQKFKKLGYYVDDIEHLGHFDGEINKSIQALRDPFLLEMEDGLHVFWAAKGLNKDGAVASSIGHARITDLEDLSSLEILKPIFPPDSTSYTQIELPNVIIKEDGKVHWYISTTNRTSEKQSENEVDLFIRSYISDSIYAPLTIPGETSVIVNSRRQEIYGANYLKDYKNHNSSKFRVFYINGVSKKKSLTLPETLDISTLSSIHPKL